MTHDIHPFAAENAMLRRTLMDLLRLVPVSEIHSTPVVTASALLGVSAPSILGHVETPEERLARKRREFDADDGA